MRPDTWATAPSICGTCGRGATESSIIDRLSQPKRAAPTLSRWLPHGRRPAAHSKRPGATDDEPCGSHTGAWATHLDKHVYEVAHDKARRRLDSDARRLQWNDRRRQAEVVVPAWTQTAVVTPAGALSTRLCGEGGHGTRERSMQSDKALCGLPPGRSCVSEGWKPRSKKLYSLLRPQTGRMTMKAELQDGS
jgi:hypothetical protein